MRKEKLICSSIDDPVFYWMKIHDSGDLSWLLEKRKKAGKTLAEYLNKVWDKLYDEFLTEFGISESYESLLRKKIEIAQLQCEMAMTGDRSLLNFIGLAKRELADLEQPMGKSGSMQAKMAIEKHYGFQVNMKTTSIREFYSYLLEIK